MQLEREFCPQYFFFVQERDGFKNILDSYESEVTVNVGKHTASRIQHLEEVVENYKKQVDYLEADLQKAYSQSGLTRPEVPQVGNIKAESNKLFGLYLKISMVT